MDFSQLIRKPEMVHAILKELPDGSVVTTKPCKIYFPVRYEEVGLATVANTVSTVAYIGIVVDDSYGIINIPTYVKLEPSFINKIKIEDTPYYELEFEENSTIFSTLECIKNDILTYYIYNEFIAGGNIPWYMKYEDLVRIFDKSRKFAGVDIGSNLEISDMVVSNIARDRKDLTKYYRSIYNGPLSEKTNPPEIVSLRNISYGATNTTAKLLGNYFSDSLTSALINPSERLESIEEKLRR